MFPKFSKSVLAVAIIVPIPSSMFFIITPNASNPRLANANAPAKAIIANVTTATPPATAGFANAANPAAMAAIPPALAAPPAAAVPALAAPPPTKRPTTAFFINVPTAAAAMAAVNAAAMASVTLNQFMLL